MRDAGIFEDVLPDVGVHLEDVVGGLVLGGGVRATVAGAIALFGRGFRHVETGVYAESQLSRLSVMLLGEFPILVCSTNSRLFFWYIHRCFLACLSIDGNASLVLDIVERSGRIKIHSRFLLSEIITSVNNSQR